MTRKHRQLRAKIILIGLIATIWVIQPRNEVRPYVDMARHEINLERQLERIKPVVKTRTVKVSRGATRRYIGEFEITAYTAGYESCGKLPDHPAYGITKSGAKVKEHHTIATDWAVLPKGTKVMIEGFPYVFTAEDVGGAIKGNKIDIYMESLTDAQEFGRQKLKVWVVE